MSYASDQVYVYTTTEVLPIATQLSLPAKSANALPPPPESPQNEYLAMMHMKKGVEGSGGSSIDSEELNSDDTPPPPFFDTNSLTDISNIPTFNDQSVSLISKPLTSSTDIMIPPPPPPQAFSVEISDSKQMDTIELNSYNSHPPTFTRNSFKTPNLTLIENNRSKSTNNVFTNKQIRSSTQPMISNSVQERIDDDPLRSVSFTSLLRQVDIGIEMMDHLKEVVRKFSKHQQTGADKLQEIYQKYPSKYEEFDGMEEFACICSLVHSLLLETVSAQKTLADFMNKSIVPSMVKHIQDKQQKIQQLKRDNHQAQMKINNAKQNMKKLSTIAKNTAYKSKNANIPKSRNEAYADKKHHGSVFSFVKKIKQGNKQDLSEEEFLYLKAKKNNEIYLASVMETNYEQKKYFEINERFKRDCKSLENSRMQFFTQNISDILIAHQQYFQNDKIHIIQNRIQSSLEIFDTNQEFNLFLNKEIVKNGKWETPSDFEVIKYEYHDVFRSLQDSMDITFKLDPDAQLPLILTTLCNKIRELNGFHTEGIFRMSASSTAIDELKMAFYLNDYAIVTKSVHIPAGLLKDWLRGLDDSLIPQSHYEMCIQMAKNEQSITSEALEVFLSQLPEVNRMTIKYLVVFLKELLDPQNIAITKMDISNIAIVFAPTLLKSPSNDRNLMLANNKHEKTFVIKLIQELQC